MVAAADLQAPSRRRAVADRGRAGATTPRRRACCSTASRTSARVRSRRGRCRRCAAGRSPRRGEGVDVLILDTAGRLHVNDDLMKELQQVRHATTPHQILLIVDAMTGQDAVNSAKAFHERLEVDGVILTKFDSDTRGGARSASARHHAPSSSWAWARRSTPSKSSTPSASPAHPWATSSPSSRRHASRSATKRRSMAEKMAEGQFTMDDFLKQMRDTQDGPDEATARPDPRRRRRARTRRSTRSSSTASRA